MKRIDPERLEHLYRQGLNASVIAARLGCTTGAVYHRIARQFAGQEHPKPYTPGIGCPTERKGMDGFRIMPRYIEHGDNGNGSPFS